jgi:hypothetical protein
MEKEAEFFLAFGNLRGNKFVIETTSLFFFDKKSFYKRKISQQKKDEINQSIFSLIQTRFPTTKFYLLYLRGSNDNKTLQSLPPQFSVIDLRPNPSKSEWDDFSPLDDHPGNLAQKIFATKIFNFLKNEFDRK